LKLSLLGTILSSLLLTTGLSFLLGGWKRTEQHFNVSLAQSICTLLLLAVSSLTIPTVLKITISESQNLYSFEQPLQEILAESRGISILIVCTYALWVFFTYSTHKSIFSMPITKGQERSSSEIGKEAIRRVALNGAITAVASDSGINPAHLHRDGRGKGKELELEECSLSLAGAMIALVTSVVLVGFNTQFATDSIQAMLQRTNVSQYFLSVIVLPLLSVDPLAIKMALRDRMDMSISLTLEKCMQTCLLVIPLTVLLAWCMGVSEMDLYLNTMILATLFLSVFTVSFAVRGGKSNWYVLSLCDLSYQKGTLAIYSIVN
jgi:Ca2+:H+ antiporter